MRKLPERIATDDKLTPRDKEIERIEERYATSAKGATAAQREDERIAIEDCHKRWDLLELQAEEAAGKFAKRERKLSTKRRRTSKENEKLDQLGLVERKVRRTADPKLEYQQHQNVRTRSPVKEKARKQHRQGDIDEDTGLDAEDKDRLEELDPRSAQNLRDIGGVKGLSKALGYKVSVHARDAIPGDDSSSSSGSEESDEQPAKRARKSNSASEFAAEESGGAKKRSRTSSGTPVPGAATASSPVASPRKKPAKPARRRSSAAPDSETESEEDSDAEEEVATPVRKASRPRSKPASASASKKAPKKQLAAKAVATGVIRAGPSAASSLKAAGPAKKALTKAQLAKDREEALDTHSDDEEPTDKVHTEVPVSHFSDTEYNGIVLYKSQLARVQAQLKKVLLHLLKLRTVAPKFRFAQIQRVARAQAAIILAEDNEIKLNWDPLSVERRLADQSKDYVTDLESPIVPPPYVIGNEHFVKPE